jgi:hypothetical protein
MRGAVEVIHRRRRRFRRSDTRRQRSMRAEMCVAGLIGASLHVETCVAGLIGASLHVETCVAGLIGASLHVERRVAGLIGASPHVKTRVPGLIGASPQVETCVTGAARSVRKEATWREVFGGLDNSRRTRLTTRSTLNENQYYRRADVRFPNQHQTVREIAPTREYSDGKSTNWGAQFVPFIVRGAAI